MAGGGRRADVRAGQRTHAPHVHPVRHSHLPAVPGAHAGRPQVPDVRDPARGAVGVPPRPALARPGRRGRCPGGGDRSPSPALRPVAAGGGTRTGGAGGSRPVRGAGGGGARRERQVRRDRVRVRPDRGRFRRRPPPGPGSLLLPRGDGAQRRPGAGEPCRLGPGAPGRPGETACGRRAGDGGARSQRRAGSGGVGHQPVERAALRLRLRPAAGRRSPLRQPTSRSRRAGGDRPSHPSSVRRLSPPGSDAALPLPRGPRAGSGSRAHGWPWSSRPACGRVVPAPVAPPRSVPPRGRGPGPSG